MLDALVYVYLSRPTLGGRSMTIGGGSMTMGGGGSMSMGGGGSIFAFIAFQELHHVADHSLLP